MSLSEVFKNIKVVHDFPTPGIVFRHFGPLLKNTELFNYAIKQMMASSNEKYDIVCGLDARGFIIATAIQNLFDIPQVMIRKQSKLPGEKYTYEYKKEYGSDILELEVDSIKSGQRVLIVDDLMATAGTLVAASNLVEQAGGIVSGIMVLIEFSDLNGRRKISDSYPFTSIHSLFCLDSTNDTQVLSSEVRVPNQIKKFRPTVYPNCDNLPVLMWHHTVESFAKKMLQVSNVRASYINWNYFPDGWPNITFEPSVTLVNKDLIFVMNISKKEIFAEQLAILVALPRQLINSLTIVVPYLGPATHERVDYSGQLATVEPILKILSSCIPMTKTGPPIIRIFDIHALQIRFYTNDSVTMKLMSAIPVLIEYLKTKKERYVIAYPDDGAHKRFKYFFEDYTQVICSKIRDGDTRKIIIRESINWPESTKFENVIIIDDLVQSGETLLVCAEALKTLGFTNISAYVTHAVFPNGAWKKFTTSSVISEFIITNTNPEVSDILIEIKPFTVLDVQTHLCSELRINNPDITTNVPKKITNIYIASTNVVKLTAVYEASLKKSSIFPNDQIFEVYSVEGISSEIPEQPLSLTETSTGALNRLMNCMKAVNDDQSIYVSIENGIVERTPIEEGVEYYCDIPVIQYKVPGTELNMLNSSTGIVLIPEQYNDLVKMSLNSINRSVTFGSIIEKKYAIKDWHKYITGESRKNIIRDAMEVLEPEQEQEIVNKKSSKTFATLTQKFNQFGAFIDTKINEIKI
jgi:adenine phosphoribosyltransferase